MGKLTDRVTSLEDALRLMERINGANKDGGKGILESFIELENKIKGFCDEKFATANDFTSLNVDFKKRMDSAETLGKDHVKRF